MEPVEISRGDGPVILAIPHAGTFLPDAVFGVLNDRGRSLADTDWHVDRLYAGLLPNATTVRATFHRYLIDANRDPAGASLYPGQNTTGLVPLTDFDGRPIWREEPSEAEIENRRRNWHSPYHAALAAEIERVRGAHGVAVLYDCHSIRSRIPFLFEGVLPDFSIGTNGGTSCAAEIEQAVNEVCVRAEGYTHVLNGRFKGGWTTRFYGRPAERVHAVQMELAQRTYLAGEAPPFAYDAIRAERLRRHLSAILSNLETCATALGDIA